MAPPEFRRVTGLGETLHEMQPERSTDNADRRFR